MENVAQFAHSLQQLLLALLMVMDLKAPKEIQALLVFLGEMVIPVFQDSRVPLVLRAPLESVNHALQVVRTILPNLSPTMSRLEEQESQAFPGQLVPQALPVPLVPLVILAPLVLQDTKVLLVNLGKLVLQALLDLLVLWVHLVLLEKMGNLEDPDDLENGDCRDLRV